MVRAMRVQAVTWMLVVASCSFPRPPDIEPPDEDVPLAITSVSPSWGSMAGGTRLTIQGSGFAAADLRVAFGAANAPEVNVVSDTEVTVVTPPGPHTPVELIITTENGTTAPFMFRYLAPLYAGDGRGGTPGNLYLVDPTTGIATTIGPIGASVTALAISQDGVLFGVTNGRGPTAQFASLLKIDPYTGSTNMVVGSLMTSAGVGGGAADIAFVGPRLYGWNKLALIEIDTETAAVTPFVDALGAKAKGGGLEAKNGSLYLLPALGNGPVYTINATTGIATLGVTLRGSNYAVSALAVVENQLLGCASTSDDRSIMLWSFDPGTGDARGIGILRTATTQLVNIDALAGIAMQ